jgi:hypothetical protein
MMKVRFLKSLMFCQEGGRRLLLLSECFFINDVEMKKNPKFQAVRPAIGPMFESACMLLENS